MRTYEVTVRIYQGTGFMGLGGKTSSDRTVKVFANDRQTAASNAARQLGYAIKDVTIVGVNEFSACSNGVLGNNIIGNQFIPMERTFVTNGTRYYYNTNNVPTIWSNQIPISMMGTMGQQF